MTSESEILPWLDPEDLIAALGRIQQEDAAEVHDAVMRLQEHENPDVREEAARVLFVLWKDPKDYANATATIANDASEAVKAVAAYGLAATAGRRNRADAQTRLLALVRNGHESSDVRAAAYDALLILNRRPNFPPKVRDFDPARDIDWTWIETLR